MPKPYIPNDRLARRAKFQGYRARSVFKLKELDERFHLLSPGQKVLDIGAAPGSWLQYASEKVGQEGQILGIDLQEIAPVSENVTTIIGDITDPNLVTTLQNMGWTSVDLILSDIAPSTTGIFHVDQKRSVELDRAIFSISQSLLRPGGNLVMKVFQGEEFSLFVKELRRYFKEVTISKSSASRDRSKEIYILCR